MKLIRSLVRVVRARHALWYYEHYRDKGDVTAMARALAKYEEIEWGPD